jgi:hypothetical protein
LEISPFDIGVTVKGHKRLGSSFYQHSFYEASFYLVAFAIFILLIKSGLLNKVFDDERSKIFKRLLVVILVLSIVGGGYLFYKDDDLNPEIIELLEEYSSNNTKQNNGSVYHMGMWSSLESSPYEVGLWRIEQYEKSLANTELSSTSIEFDDYPEEDWIEEILPEAEKPKWFCDYDESGCLESIYSKSEQAIYLGDTFAKHIERYNGVFNYTDFGIYQQPSIYGPMMMFGPGIDVLKIKLILNLHNFKLGKRKAVIEELIQLLNHHKSVLGQTPYTVSKVVSVVELQLIYKASAFLISKKNDEHLSIWKPYIDSLVQLEKDQLTFNKPLNHEFISSYNSFQIAGLGNFRKDLPSILKYLPKSFLYKPNRTANLMFKGLTVKRGQYELLSDRIIIHKKPNINDAIKFDLSNAIGSILALTVTPKFVDLDGAMYDLEVLQRLTKHLYEQRVNNSDVNFLSPYTGIEGAVNGKFYCIDSNPKNEKPLCLSVI